MAGKRKEKKRRGQKSNGESGKIRRAQERMLVRMIVNGRVSENRMHGRRMRER